MISGLQTFKHPKNFAREQSKRKHQDSRGKQRAVTTTPNCPFPCNLHQSVFRVSGRVWVRSKAILASDSAVSPVNNNLPTLISGHTSGRVYCLPLSPCHSGSPFITVALMLPLTLRRPGHSLRIGLFLRHFFSPYDGRY